MKWSPRLLPLVLMPMLASCSATTGRPAASISTLPPPSTKAPTPISATDPLCTSLVIIQLSRADTTGTKLQVEANNAVLTRVCQPQGTIRKLTM